MSFLILALSALSVVIWLVLLGWRGGFWQCDQVLERSKEDQGGGGEYPTVWAVIPARNEAELLPVTLRSLLQQDYPGQLQVILVDDHSTDGTATVAQATAAALGQVEQLTVLAAEPLPPGWSGKLWAMDQGVQKALTASPDYILLTDADICHDRSQLWRLVTQARHHDLAMASVMVRLRCESRWEKLLIPAFVFFFQKLYPFRWVNDSHRSTAAAAGGCILIRRDVLEQIGGLQTIRQALIDDCALAQAVKGKRGNAQSMTSPQLSRNIWLGLSDLTCSLRPYPSLQTVWDMVARTAYTQLNYSPLLLLGTLVGMTMIYLMPPIALAMGTGLGNAMLVLTGLAGWLLMTLAYYPTVQFYRCSLLFAASLPAIALLYTLMTIDSAWRHWQGRGGAWKGRVYPD
ncbi:glycosyltransferase [Pantanalinema sp. GBBB05]|uniref:glycosyltransferase n=1 Tax=Pantanalinema sp. GBBB05 TaxID=2604139 RepID=UPI001D48AA33|nr:glycosyltransferase [Pantanalinema sp. GBBB05]